MESSRAYAGTEGEREMKLEIVKKTVTCPISNEPISITRCKNCTYRGKIEKEQMECEFK